MKGLQFFLTMAAIALLTISFSCSNEPDEVSSPQSELAKIPVSREQTDVGYSWLNHVGSVVSTVFEVDTQAEWETALFDHEPGDTILLQDDGPFTCVVNYSPYCAILGTAVIGDNPSERPVVIIDPFLVYALLMNNISATPSLEKIAVNHPYGHPPGESIITFGGGTSRTWVIRDVVLGHDSDESVTIRAVAPFTLEDTGPLGDPLLNVPWTEGGLRVATSNTTVTLDNVTWIDLGSNDCDPPIKYDHGSTNNEVEFKTWGEFVSDGSDPDPWYSVVANVDPTNETLVGFSGHNCKTTVEYKVDWGGFPDNESVASFEVEYGEASFTNSQAAIDVGGGWYRATFLAMYYPSCEFVWRAKITLCSGNGNETVFVGSSQYEDLECGICGP